MTNVCIMSFNSYTGTCMFTFTMVMVLDIILLAITMPSSAIPGVQYTCTVPCVYVCILCHLFSLVFAVIMVMYYYVQQ